MLAASSFDFEAAVTAPFRMQPGLRRIADGGRHLTPLAAGALHQREKLAVLGAFWPQSFCAVPGTDALPALHALCALAAAEHPQAWRWDGSCALSVLAGVRVHADGRIESQQPGGCGGFTTGAEVARCLRGLPPEWRLAGLLSLSFAEDYALVDAASGQIDWLAITLPSHWVPEDKVGRHFTAVHAPVADNQLLLRASESLMKLVTGPERWERFVWTVTDHPRLHAHPARVDDRRWAHTPVERAWFRTERQTFVPLPARAQAVFTIGIGVQPLATVAASPQRAARLHDAIASMSDAVLAYRGLTTVREPLLAWLALRARGGAQA